MIVFGVDFSKGSEHWLNGVQKNLAKQSQFVKIGSEWFYDMQGNTEWVTPTRQWLNHKDGFNLSMRIRRPASFDKYSYIFTAYDGSTYLNGLILALRESGAFFFQIGRGSSESKMESPQSTLASGETADFEFIFERASLALIIKKNGTEVVRSTASGDMSTQGLVQYIMGGDPRRSGRLPDLQVSNLKLSTGTTISDESLPIARDEYKLFVMSNHKGFVAGKVLIKGVPTARQVICVARANKKVIATTWSDDAGNYRFDNLVKGSEYICLAIDHTRNYNAVVQDMIRAE
ncbi:hypothetical protein [Psychrobacter aquimaris]|uniref:hypothetical protein n=1 Tax=Psychrobacter aquimaris TaxID=292733 RepID=UPI0039C65F65